MLDIKLIRKNPELVAEKLSKKKFDFDVAAFKQLDDARKQADTDSQTLLAERKQASKKIGELVKQGIPVDEAKQTVNETLAKIEEQLNALKQKAQIASDALESFQQTKRHKTKCAANHAWRKKNTTPGHTAEGCAHGCWKQACLYER